MTRDELIAIARQTAEAHQLDPVLVCAVIEQESNWDTDAIRYEDGFFHRYIEPQGILSSTEARARSFSWGLMQVMGQVAREFGFKGQYLSSLCNPTVGIDVGCKVLKSKLASKSSVELGLLAYNGGGNPNYGKEVLARMEKYG